MFENYVHLTVLLLLLFRSKPEQAMYLGLMYLAKTRPTVFGSEVVIDVGLNKLIPN